MGKQAPMSFSVRVTRTTRFYMLNYVLIVATLTSISWVVFVLPVQQLSNRCTISLTLILALNVFQLIVNDSTPKTNYLSPMHEFIISSTFFVVLTALESVAVHIAVRRVNLKSAVIRKFIQRTYNDKRRSKGFVGFMRRLESIRRRNRQNGVVVDGDDDDEEKGENDARRVEQDEEQGGAATTWALNREAGSSGGVKVVNGGQGQGKQGDGAAGGGEEMMMMTTKKKTEEEEEDTMFSSQSDIVNAPGPMASIRKRERPGAAASTASMTVERHASLSSVGSTMYGREHVNDLTSTVDVVSREQSKRDFDHTKKELFHASRASKNVVGAGQLVNGSVTILDWVDSWVAHRADDVSLVMFPLAYTVTMCYIFLAEHK